MLKTYPGYFRHPAAKEQNYFISSPMFRTDDAGNQDRDNLPVDVHPQEGKMLSKPQHMFGLFIGESGEIKAEA